MKKSPGGCNSISCTWWICLNKLCMSPEFWQSERYSELPCSVQSVIVFDMVPGPKDTQNRTLPDMRLFGINRDDRVAWRACYPPKVCVVFQSWHVLKCFVFTSRTTAICRFFPPKTFIKECHILHLVLVPFNLVEHLQVSSCSHLGYSGSRFFTDLHFYDPWI